MIMCHSNGSLKLTEARGFIHRFLNFSIISEAAREVAGLSLHPRARRKLNCFSEGGRDALPPAIHSHE